MPKALQVALPTAETQHLSRLRYEISCPDGQGWEVVATVKPDIYLPIWVAKQTLERGRKVQADDIELKKKNITGVQGGYITDPDETRFNHQAPYSPVASRYPLAIRTARFSDP